MTKVTHEHFSHHRNLHLSNVNVVHVYQHNLNYAKKILLPLKLSCMHTEGNIQTYRHIYAIQVNG